MDRTADHALYTPRVHAVLFRASASLGETGQGTSAQDHFHHMHARTVERLGPDHPDTLTARGNLARWRGAAGDAAAFAELLEDRLRVLGPDHPHTLATRKNLAYWQGQAGDAAGADSGGAINGDG